eukprot:scaffold7515_cov61-Phaeocystis_antarctica.AAC.2
MQAALKSSKAAARLLDLFGPTPSTRFDDEEMNRDGVAERFEQFYVLRCIVSARQCLAGSD